LLAKVNFPEFKKQKLKSIQQAFTEQAGYRGSLSVGAALIKPTESVGHALARAETQAGKVKATYKNRYGVGESKYGFDSKEKATIRNRRGPPVPLDPE